MRRIIRIRFKIMADVSTEPEVAGGDSPSRSALDWIVDQSVDDPSVPTDLAHQHDHYLYGKPRESASATR